MDLGSGGLNNPGPSGYGGYSSSDSGGYDSSYSYQPTTSQLDSISTGGGGGGDPYQDYIKASQPRGILNSIKNYFTGGGYDYGYNRTLAKDIRGLPSLLLGLVNPALGLAYKGYQTFKPELNLFKNSPTLEAFLNNRKNLYEEDTVPTLEDKIKEYYSSIYDTPEKKSAKDYINLDESIADTDLPSIDERIAYTTGFRPEDVKLVNDINYIDPNTMAPNLYVNKGPFYASGTINPTPTISAGADLGPFSYNISKDILSNQPAQQYGLIGLAPGLNFGTNFNDINSITGARTFDTPLGIVTLGGNYNLTDDSYGLGANWKYNF